MGYSLMDYSLMDYSQLTDNRRSRRSGLLGANDSTEQSIDDPGIPLTFGLEVECYVFPDSDILSAEPNVVSYLCHQFTNASLPTVACHEPYAESPIYTTWTVTMDCSLDSHIRQADSGEQPGTYVVPKLESNGIELVSRPMPVPSVLSAVTPARQPQMQETGRYLSVLSGRRGHGVPEPGLPHRAVTDRTCALHVHIGRPGGEQLPLDILRHVAYLIFLYEPLMSSLHPYHRRPYPNMPGEAFCGSNMTAFQIDNHTCHQFRPCFVPLAQARRRIFNPDMELSDLAWLMGAPFPLDDRGYDKAACGDDDSSDQTQEGEPGGCPRGGRFCDDPDRLKIVNWLGLICPSRPNTLEFRQAAGTLDPDEIAWTAQLYTALVREAERRAGRGLGEFSFGEERLPTDLGMFLSTLRLPATAIRYWTRRHARLYQEAALAGWREDSLCRRQVCQECDAEAWS